MQRALFSSSVKDCVALSQAEVLVWLLLIPVYPISKG